MTGGAQSKDYSGRTPGERPPDGPGLGRGRTEQRQSKDRARPLENPEQGRSKRSKSNPPSRPRRMGGTTCLLCPQIPGGEQQSKKGVQDPT